MSFSPRLRPAITRRPSWTNTALNTWFSTKPRESRTKRVFYQRICANLNQEIESCSQVPRFKTISVNSGVSSTFWCPKCLVIKKSLRKCSISISTKKTKIKKWVLSRKCIRFWSHFCWGVQKVILSKSCRTRSKLTLACRFQSYKSIFTLSFFSSMVTLCRWLPTKTPSCNFEKFVIIPIRFQVLSHTASMNMVNIWLKPLVSCRLSISYSKRSWDKMSRHYCFHNLQVP